MIDLWQLMCSDQAPLKPDIITEDQAPYWETRPHPSLCSNGLSSVLWAHRLSIRVVSKHFKPSVSSLFSTFHWNAPAVAYRSNFEKASSWQPSDNFKIKNLNQLIPNINYFFLNKRHLRVSDADVLFIPLKALISSPQLTILLTTQAQTQITIRIIIKA